MPSFGSSVNRYLIHGMAKLGGGEPEVVLPSSPGDAVAERFWERIRSPVLADVRVAFHGLEVVDVYPRDLSDVRAQRPLLVQARYRRPGQGRLVLRGFRQGRPYEQVLDVELPDRAEANAVLAARARVDDLMSRDLCGLQAGSSPHGLRDEIVELALTHHLLTRFTSFVAVEERVVNEGDRQRTLTVPVEMPQGVTYEGVFGEPADVLARPSTAAARLVSPSPPALGVRRYMDVGRLTGGEHIGPAEVAERLRALCDAAVERSSRPGEPGTGKRDEALSEVARARLAPELLALVEGGSASPLLDLVGGRVRVQVTTARITPERVAALEAAGLQIVLETDTSAVGRVAVERLGALAELGFVTRIEPV